MRIVVYLGSDKSGTQMTWDKGIKEFPHYVKHLGKNYEWVYYDEGEYGIDYTLFFSEVKNDRGVHGDYYRDFNDLLWGIADSCQCGARHTSFPQSHMQFCPKWSPF